MVAALLKALPRLIALTDDSLHCEWMLKALMALFRQLDGALQGGISGVLRLLLCLSCVITALSMLSSHMLCLC